MRPHLLVAIAVLGCGAGTPAARDIPGLQASGVGAVPNPIVKSPHLIPVLTDETNTYGVEAGGGLRTLTQGVRVLNLPSGGAMSTTDRFHANPTFVVEIPLRMGGGFLFVHDSAIWQADRWLGEAKAIYASPYAISALFMGLDRAYVRTSNGLYAAFDPRTGHTMDLGPWPSSPYVGSYVAADGWRAVALTDLRGVVATFDAGVTWRSLPVGIDPKQLLLKGDRIIVGGPDATHSTQWFSIGPDGDFGKTTVDAIVTLKKGETKEPTQSSSPRTFGERPLLAAVEDGWPLTDGTAIVARDGILARIRLEDGMIVEQVADAFPIKPSRCHPVPLYRSRSPGAFGFVCGVPRGATILYSYDPFAGRLSELRHFVGPRVVLSSGNGALVIRGPCDPEAKGDEVTAGVQAYCILGHDDTFRDLVVRGDVGSERIVALRDGRTVVISPPQGDLATARITIFEGGKPKTIPIEFTLKPSDSEPPSSEYDEDGGYAGARAGSSEIERAIRSGAWLDGFEERDAGHLAGWIETGGSMLGIDIDLTGKAHHGEYITDLGSPIVSGRFGIGWSNTHAFETFDGGMSWRALEVPDPLETTVASRACGPVGCSVAGWIRVGWMEAPPATKPYTPSTPSYSGTYGTKAMKMTCRLAGKLADPGNEPQSNTQSYSYYGYYGRTPTMASEDWQPFLNIAAPKLATDELGWSRETFDVIDRANPPRNGDTRVGSLIRPYAWGPKGIEWQTKGRFMMRWSWPYESSRNIHATQMGSIPSAVADSARFFATTTYRQMQPLQVALGDDATHMLLAVRRTAPTVEVVLIEAAAERAPVEVRRGDGGTFQDIDSAVRVGGHWYVAVPSSDPVTTIIYEIDSGVARELLRVPRLASDGRSLPVRLARRADNRAIGVVVEGLPTAAHPSVNTRWIAPIALDSALLGEPRDVGPVDFSNALVTRCSADDGGFIVDMPYTGSLQLDLPSGSRLSPSGFRLARMHLHDDHACIERLSVKQGIDEADLVTKKPVPLAEPIIDVAVFSNTARQMLQCGAPAEPK